MQHKIYNKNKQLYNIMNLSTANSRPHIASLSVMYSFNIQIYPNLKTGLTK